MAIDAGIYDQFKTYTFATLGDLANATAKRKETESMTAERQSITAARTAQLAKQQKDAEDEAREAQAIQAVFQKHTGPDGPDRKAIVNELYTVSPSAAQKVEDAFAKTLKSAADARKVELDNQNTVASQIAQRLQAVTPQTYKPIWSSINAIDPEMAAFLGPEFNPDRVQQAVAAGTSRTEYNNAYKEILASKKTDTEKALGLLSIAKDAAHAQDAMAFAKLHGVDGDLMAMGFQPDDPNIAQRATDFLLGPKERATLAEQQADNTRQAQQFAQSNAIQQGQLAVSRGQLGVAQGNLALRKQEANKPAAGGEGGVKLSAGQQQDLETMLTISDMAKEVRALGDQTGWAGTGGGKMGTLNQTFANLTGMGDPRNISLRNKVNNIKATIAKLRGGTAFTPNEEALLNSYTPTIDDADSVLKQKLTDLESFIETKRRNMLKIASGDLSANGPAPAASGRPTLSAEELIKKYGGGK